MNKIHSFIFYSLLFYNYSILELFYILWKLKEGIEPSIHKYELYGLPLTYFSLVLTILVFLIFSYKVEIFIDRERIYKYIYSYEIDSNRYLYIYIYVYI